MEGWLTLYSYMFCAYRRENHPENKETATATDQFFEVFHSGKAAFHVGKLGDGMKSFLNKTSVSPENPLSMF
jgi:hypothetical protein